MKKLLLLVLFISMVTISCTNSLDTSVDEIENVTQLDLTLNDHIDFKSREAANDFLKTLGQTKKATDESFFYTIGDKCYRADYSSECQEWTDYEIVCWNGDYGTYNGYVIMR